MRWSEYLCAAGESCSLVSLVLNFIFCLTLKDFTLQPKTPALALTSWETLVRNFLTDTMPSNIILSKWLWTVRAKHPETIWLGGLIPPLRVKIPWRAWCYRPWGRDCSKACLSSAACNKGCYRVRRTAFGCLNLKGKKEAGHQVGLQDLQFRYSCCQRFQLQDWEIDCFPLSPTLQTLKFVWGRIRVALSLLNPVSWG